MSWSIFSDGGGSGAALTWAQQLLEALGAPLSQSNITFVYQWEESEGGGGVYNPLNQGVVPGNSSLTNSGNQYGGGAANYISWEAGIQGAVDYLHMSNYTGVYAALKAGNGQQAQQALFSSPWASSHYGYGSEWSSATPPSTGTALDSSGGGVNEVLQPYDPTTNVTATISPQELAQEYGYAYSMLTSIPELNTLFQQAVAGQWDATRFSAALMGTKWYQDHSAAQRAWIAEGYTDPATQTAQLDSQIQEVQLAASKLGAVISPAEIKALATDYLQDGWNSDQLQHAMTQWINFDANGALGGTSGDDEMTLRSLAADNGVSVSNSWLLNVARNISTETTSLEDAEGYIRQQAETLYPNYASLIKAGQNLSDLAAPYATDYQNILEVGPGNTSLYDSTMQKALQYKDPTGVNKTMPLWQFDQTLRNDPRWLQTQNAQNTTMSTAHSILQDFGFAF
jgi:hypothetical protein